MIKYEPKASNPAQTPTQRTSLKFFKCQNRTGGSLKMGEPHNTGRDGCPWPGPSPNSDGLAPKKSRVTPRVALRLSSHSPSRARPFPPLFLITRGDPRPSTCVISADISLFSRFICCSRFACLNLSPNFSNPFATSW